MAVTLLFLGTKASISDGLESLTLDASISESHQGRVTTTSHPVEQGVKITDHKYREPDTLTMEGIISNDPMPDPATVPTQDTFTTPNGGTLQYSYRSTYQAGLQSQAYQVLLDLLDSPNLLSIVTAIRSYSNFVLTNLDVPRSQETVDALRFTATFTEVRVVQNQTVQVQAKIAGAQKPQDLHKKTADTASNAQKKKSILKSITDSQFGQHPLDTIAKIF
jgi:hypothetical protein